MARWYVVSMTFDSFQQLLSYTPGREDSARIGKDGPGFWWLIKERPPTGFDFSQTC